MRKITFLLAGLFFMFVITGTNVAYSFSIRKPIYSAELMKYVKGSEFIKLSFKQFAMLTGEKENLWNKISFDVLKMKIKHDLKKNPDLTLNEYNKSKHKMALGWRILIWVAGILLLLILVVAIFGKLN